MASIPSIQTDRTSSPTSSRAPSAPVIDQDRYARERVKVAEARERFIARHRGILAALAK